MSKSYKIVASDGTPEDLVTMSYEELDNLKEELEQWRDGMMGTNLESSEKYNMLDEAVNALEECQAPEPETWPHNEARISYSDMVPKRKRRNPSRAVRLANATGRLQAVIDFYQSLDEQPDEVTELVEHLEQHVIEVELPGMYG